MQHRSTRHLIQRIGWLRAAVLGANDGIISTSSLIVGIAAAQTSSSTVMLTGIAALCAGAISMAAGEYVSVSSQADVESADRVREEREHASEPEEERKELIAIYEARGLDPELAVKVADQLMARDPITTHLRDELGHRRFRLPGNAQEAEHIEGILPVRIPGSLELAEEY